MLNNIDKNKNPFKVPENYFENFDMKIMEQLPEKGVQTKIVPLWKKVLPWTAVAAALFGILFFVGVFNGDMNPGKFIAEQKKGNVETADTYIDEDDIEDYYLFLQDEVQKSQYKEMMYNY